MDEGTPYTVGAIGIVALTAGLEWGKHGSYNGGLMLIVGAALLIYSVKLWRGGTA